MTNPWMANPGNFSTFLQSSYIRPGTIIELEEGSYEGDYTCSVSGVTFKPVKGARATIDGSMIVTGNNTTWQDLEITYSKWTTRITPYPGEVPSGLHFLDGFSIYSSGTQIINCIFHDCAEGVVSTAASIGTICYGNVFYNNGWDGPDRSHGHGIYFRNSNSTTKYSNNNIFAGGYGWGIHYYSDKLSELQNLVANNNICYFAGNLDGPPYHNNIIVGGEGGAQRVTVDNNCTYGGEVGQGLFFGYSYGIVSDGTLTNNYSTDGIKIKGSGITQFNNYSGVVEDEVFIYPNIYKVGGNIAIYNASQASVVSVNISSISGLNPGDTVTLRNAQNYYDDYTTAIIDEGGNVLVSMINHTTASAIASFTPNSSFPTFGAFILEKI